MIDDEVFEEDEHFYCKLSNPRYLYPENKANGGAVTRDLPELQLGTPAIATVMILDDDHSGIFAFPEPAFEVPESIGLFSLKVNRHSGARGRVLLPFKTVEGSAKDERDFLHGEGKVIFENNQTRYVKHLPSFGLL